MLCLDRSNREASMAAAMADPRGLVRRALRECCRPAGRNFTNLETNAPTPSANVRDVANQLICTFGGTIAHRQLAKAGTALNACRCVGCVYQAKARKTTTTGDKDTANVITILIAAMGVSSEEETYLSHSLTKPVGCPQPHDARPNRLG